MCAKIFEHSNSGFISPIRPVRPILIFSSLNMIFGVIRDAVSRRVEKMHTPVRRQNIPIHESRISPKLHRWDYIRSHAASTRPDLYGFSSNGDRTIAKVCPQAC